MKTHKHFGNLVKGLLITVLCTGAIIGLTACKPEPEKLYEQEVSQAPVTLSFFSETYATGIEEYTLQSENAALLYALGDLAIDQQGQFSIGYGPIDIENPVFFPGNAGTIEAQMSISDASWSGTYNSKTKKGSGDYSFTYELKGQEAGQEASVIVYLKGQLSIAPSEQEAHKDRLELTLSGTSSREITIGGTTNKVDDDDYAITYIYSVK